MSLQDEDQSLLAKAPETFHESPKHSKLSYTREFLLSISKLDACQKLPSGFDQSILSEFEDTSHSTQDRQRISGNFLFQGFRRSDYGSSPPTRGDSWNNSRGIYGRWDSRSSGRSDMDSDSQSDLDSDSGKCYGDQSRPSLQSTEHDGLLGSGSFPRTCGYAAGMSTPKVQANDHYQLNRSNEPYHPPRPYKAVPHLRRETNDSLNDETFGSSECTSEDRAEEERRRRASFELMRKEQQKALQEKQKSSIDKHRNHGVSDIAMLLEDMKTEKRLLDKKNELDVLVTPSVSNNDSGKSSLASQVPPSRPLVPPGFTSSILEKNAGTKSLVHPQSREVGIPDIEQSLLHANISPLQNGTLHNQEERESRHEMGLSEQLPEDKSIHAPYPDKGEKIENTSPGPEVSNEKLGMDEHQYRISSLSEAHEDLGNGEIIELNAKVTGHKIVSDSNHGNSSSILEQIFGSALTTKIGGTSDVIKHNDSKLEDTWSPKTVQSSKFAQWFSEEETKPADDLSLGWPNDLLSLIVGGEKGGLHVSEVKATQHIPSQFSYPRSEVSKGLMTSNIPSLRTGISEPLYDCIKQEAVPAVLTCEDLEQTILSQFSEKSSTLEPSVQSWSVSGAKAEQPRANVDDCASQHLLSLLQKGTVPNSMAQPPLVDTVSSDKLHVPELGSTVTALDNPTEANVKNSHNMGKTLTLETLFGTAFMTELKSVEAPVSIQRGSVGSARYDVMEPHGSTFPVLDDGLFPSTVGEIGYQRTRYESNVLASNHRQQTKLDKSNNWLRYDDPLIELDSSELRNEVASNHDGFDGAVEVQLPEEESLIALGDSANPPNSIFMPAGYSSKGELASSTTPVDIAEKLAALNVMFKDERSLVGQEGTSFVRGPYDLMEHEIPYHNLHAQPSTPQFHLPQTSHGRPLFHQLDSHPANVSSQMKFMAPESIIHHDTPPSHQFSTNMLRPPFQHTNTRMPGFDLPSSHPLLQHRQMPNNYPPPHLLHEFPRGARLPPHPSNGATGFMQDPNMMQRFPFGHQQPNLSGIGTALPALEVNSGSNHPEAFQRLIEMERRANAKQTYPFPVGHNQGMYGCELDRGFHYR
ncbi:unnamed protein product [Ilex paraguariensis]|uniref:Uncharacterized protein n=1 Tax=Ilex paraguariensis TaxID=185542 RepID=A0ABC8SHP9_9AQUA